MPSKVNRHGFWSRAYLEEMNLTILVKGGVGSDDYLIENVSKGDPTTLYNFLNSIMMKEFRGRSDIQFSQNVNLKFIKRNSEEMYGEG